MKKLTALLLCLALLVVQAFSGLAEETAGIQEFRIIDEKLVFDDLNDPELLQYLEDSVYASLDGSFASDDYIINDISVIYISQEYLEEVAFNTRANIYFGYTLAELEEEFEGNRYIFTCSNDGQTIVQEFETFPDNTNEVILKNILIGTGVILICVTVSVISGGIASGAATGGAAKTISMIFAASANSATKMAIGGTVFSAATTAVIRGIETGDMSETVRSSKLAASEGFKWGAIFGAVTGGYTEAKRIHTIKSTPVPSYQVAEDQVAEAYKYTRRQVSFLDRKEVPGNTPNATRPDGIRFIDGHWEAIEVKRYDLTMTANRDVLKKELIRQVSQRCIDLPAGMTQRIVLNVTGRGYTAEFMQEQVQWLHSFLDPIYPDIPIDVFGGAL